MKKVVGIQSVDYLSRKTNQPVQGVTLHLTYQDSRITGVGTETVFVSAKATCYGDVVKIPIGSDVDVFYNRYGSIEEVRPVRK